MRDTYLTPPGCRVSVPHEACRCCTGAVIHRHHFDDSNIGLSLGVVNLVPAQVRPPRQSWARVAIRLGAECTFGASAQGHSYSVKAEILRSARFALADKLFITSRCVPCGTVKPTSNSGFTSREGEDEYRDEPYGSAGTFVPEWRRNSAGRYLPS